MTNPPEQPDEDPLRQAVRDALDAPVDELRVARLKRFWRESSRQDTLARRRWVVLAAAALLLVAVGISAWRWPQGPGGPVEVVEQHTAPSTPPAGGASRAPTAYEVAAFYTLAPRKPGTRTIAVELDRAPPSMDAEVEELLAERPPDAARRFARLAPKSEAYAALAQRSEQPRVAVLLAELDGRRSERGRPARLLAAASPEVIDHFVADLRSDHTPTRRTAAVVLGRIGGQQVAQRLIDEIADDPRNTAAWWTLANTQSAAAQEFLEYASRQPRLLGFLNAAQARWSAGKI